MSCRLCLSDRNVKSVFDPTFKDGSIIKDYIALALGVNIAITDQVTTGVCKRCEGLLTMFLRFRKRSRLHDTLIKIQYYCDMYELISEGIHVKLEKTDGILTKIACSPNVFQELNTALDQGFGSGQTLLDRKPKLRKFDPEDTKEGILLKAQVKDDVRLTCDQSLEERRQQIVRDVEEVRGGPSSNRMLHKRKYCPSRAQNDLMPKQKKRFVVQTLVLHRDTSSVKADVAHSKTQQTPAENGAKLSKEKPKPLERATKISASEGVAKSATTDKETEITPSEHAEGVNKPETADETKQTAPKISSIEIAEGVESKTTDKTNEIDEGVESKTTDKTNEIAEGVESKTTDKTNEIAEGVEPETTDKTNETASGSSDVTSAENKPYSFIYMKDPQKEECGSGKAKTIVKVLCKCKCVFSTVQACLNHVGKGCPYQIKLNLK